VPPVDFVALDAQFDVALDNKVLWVKGSLETIDNISIKNGSLLGSDSGAGVVVVDGDLDIHHEITYQANPTYTNLRQIPSIVWIIKGDLNIDPSVTEVAGTFVILGDGTSTDDPPCSGDPVIHAGCGQIATAFGGDVPPGVQLVIRGSIIARHFDLGRLYHTTNDPAERFINDGRLQANPPNGMTDFSRVVPRFE